MNFGGLLKDIRCLRKTFSSYAVPRAYNHTRAQEETMLKAAIPDPSYLATLKPSTRKRIIGQTAHKHPQLASQATSLRPADYGHFLLHSKDLGSIIPALTHPYPSTRTLAAKAFHRAWVKAPPEETLRALGGVDGLADILDKLSYNDAMTIASYMGRSYFGPSDRRTHTLEALVKLLVPNLSKDSPSHPVSRLGPAFVSRFIPALSPPLISQLLPLVEREGIRYLSKVVYRHPAYVVDVMLTESSKVDDLAIQFGKRALKWLFAQRSIHHSPANDSRHWGIQNLVKIISAQQPDKIVFKPSLDDLFQYATVALKSARNTKDYFSVVESILTRAEKEQAAGNATYFNQVRRMTLSLASTLSQAVKEESKARISLASKCLRRLGRVISGGRFSSTLDHGIQSCLQDVAPSVRLQFLRLIHNLPDDTQWKFPEDWSRISAPLLTLLSQEDGKPILRQMDVSLGKPGYTPKFETIPADRVKTIIDLLRDEPHTCPDAVTVALQGYWAFSQNDAVLQEQTRQDIKRWKELVHRLREPEDRSKYLNTLLTIAATTGDSSILNDSLVWAYQRFGKDREVRHVLEQTPHIYSDILAGDVRNLEESAARGNEILSRFIDMLNGLKAEHDFRACDFDTVFTSIRMVLIRRLDTCQRGNVPIETAEALISPLQSLFLHAERIQLDDSATFGKHPPYPRLYSEKYYDYKIGDYWPHGDMHSLTPRMELSRDYRRILVRFMDQLGRARHKLYAEVKKEPNETDVTTYKRFTAHKDRFAWPYEVAGGYLRDLPWQQDAPFLVEYIRKIVFTPVDNDQSKEDDAHKHQMYKALNLLVTATPPNQKSQTDTLLPIIEHYRTKAMDSKRRKVDLSALLLQSTKFKDTVHRNEVLFEAFYAPYLADNRQSPNSPNLNIFFGLPQFYKSGPVDGLQDPHFDLLRRRQCVKSYTALYEHLLPVNRQVRCSQNLHRHFTLIAAVGWVHSLQLSRKYLNSFIASQNSCDSSDSSKSDLVALYQNSLPPYNISIGLFGRPEIPNFISGVDLLSPEEIRTLVQITRTRKAKGADKLRLDIALKRLCNRILVHSHCPLLAEEEIFKVLMDTDKSTSHRHFFTIKWLRSLPREESRRLVQRLRNLVLAASEEEVSIKLTTIKHLVDIINHPATGLSPEEMIAELTQLAKSNKHPSIQRALLSSMVNLLAKRSRSDPSPHLKKLWEDLSRLALTSSSLNEERLLQDEDWSREDLPQITFNNTRPKLLMGIPITSLPSSARPVWATLIDKMLGEQVTSTRRWMSEFIQRNGATVSEIDGIDCGPLLSCMSRELYQSYSTLRKYLPPNSWHLRILKSQLTLPLFERGLRTFISRLSENDVDWKSKQNGRDFVELLRLCSLGYDDSFQTLLSTLQDHGTVESRDALMAGLQVYLQPQYMLMKIDNPLSKSAPWEFVSNLVWKLKPTTISSSQSQNLEGWKAHIQLLVMWLRDFVQQASVQEGQNPALYMKLMIDIDSVALPFPILEPEQVDRHELFANQLLELVTRVHDHPLGFIHLGAYFEDYVAKIRPLLDDSFAVATSLVEIAEKQTNPARKLLGYRLFLSIAQFIISNRPTDNEKERRIFALVEQLVTHKDQNVQALIIGHPNCFVRDIEQEEEDSSDSEYYSDSD